jgi:ATP adenylyltransferase
MEYVVGAKPEHCVFCAKAEQDNDAENQVLFRGRHCYIVVNAYPYNSGHVMVVPYRHLSHISELDVDELTEMGLVAQCCARVMTEFMYAEGINMGMNIGQAAGAGIEDHLHLHLVPRWSGDTNYITTVAGVRVVPQAPEETYEGLLEPLREAMAEVMDRHFGNKDTHSQ